MKKQIPFLTITLLLVLISALCVGGTVLCRNKGETIIDTEAYRIMEKQYRTRIRDIMETRGYADCGITMTYTAEKGSARSYRVTLHHRRLEQLSGSDQKALTQELSMIAFPVPECNFKFITTLEE